MHTYGGLECVASLINTLATDYEKFKYPLPQCREHVGYILLLVKNTFGFKVFCIFQKYFMGNWKYLVFNQPM